MQEKEPLIHLQLGSFPMAGMKLPFACPMPGLPAAQAAAPCTKVPYAAGPSWPADANVIQAAIMMCLL